MKKIFIFLFVIFGFLLNPHPLRAANEFNSNVNVTYHIDQSGKSIVTHDVVLENVFSDLYATSYSLVLENIEPINPRATEGENILKLETKKEGENTILKVIFETAVVGKGSKRNFNISFEEGRVAVKTGEVWEINIPRLSADSFDSYTLSLHVPKSFGQLAYVSPTPLSVSENEGERIYVFDKNSVTATGVTAGFGAFQVFNFNLSYHLENPLSKTALTEIAIPPDTPLQKVYYDKLEPAPTEVVLDEDGNWIAKYILKPRERVDVNAIGSVQIFSGPRPFFNPTTEMLSKNLEEKDYWETKDPYIASLATNLRTPRAIYDYVTSTLSYDYEKVKPNVERLGAKKALMNPTSAICMEFTDLFIALARAAGIPAREINGYAYTENPEIEPLSLVADVLHSWPEYWDASKSAWIPVDPTWASTTGGVDFFNKFDLRHFAFVIHGTSSTRPFPPGSYKLGPNPQKDVFVNFGSLPEVRQGVPQISVVEKRNIPFVAQRFTVSVKNPGPSALYNQNMQVLFDGKENQNTNLEVLPPYATYTFEVAVPFTFLGGKTPHKVTIALPGNSLDISTSKNQVILYSLLGFSLLALLGIIIFLLKLRRVAIGNALFRVKQKYEQFIARFKKVQGK